MENSENACAEILVRLRPVLEQVFATYRLSEQQAQEIVEQSCFLLIGKRPMRQDPEGWLLRTIIEKCQRLREEAAVEDSSE